MKYTRIEEVMNSVFTDENGNVRFVTKGLMKDNKRIQYSFSEGVQNIYDNPKEDVLKYINDNKYIKVGGDTHPKDVYEIF